MEQTPVDSEPWAMQFDGEHVIVWLDGDQGHGKTLTNFQARTLILTLQHALRIYVAVGLTATAERHMREPCT